MKKKKIFLYIAVFFGALLIGLAIAFQHSRNWENGFILEPLYKIESEEKVVAFTFDDGPSEGRTPALLEVLDKYEVKATFFMLGKNIEQNSEIAKQVVEKGHLIGNHSYDHPRFILKSSRFTKEQIEKTDKLIKELGQEEVKFFRPPYSSKFIVLPWVLKSMDKALVTGTYDPPSEYQVPYNGYEVAKEIIENTNPGTIIYLHDGKKSDVEEFVISVEKTIVELQKQGYTFVTLDEYK